MKKYFLPVLAVVLAIGFSAFTAPKKIKSNKEDTYLYWYFYDLPNDKLAGQIGDVPQLHREAVYATGCTDHPLGTFECARGYEFEQYPYQESPGVGNDRVVEIPW